MFLDATIDLTTKKFYQLPIYYSVTSSFLFSYYCLLIIVLVNGQNILEMHMRSYHQQKNQITLIWFVYDDLSCYVFISQVLTSLYMFLHSIILSIWRWLPPVIISIFSPLIFMWLWGEITLSFQYCHVHGSCYIKPYAFLTYIEYFDFDKWLLNTVAKRKMHT